MATQHSNELNAAYAHRLEGNDLESFPADAVGNALSRAISILAAIICDGDGGDRNITWAAQKEVQDAQELIEIWRKHGSDSRPSQSEGGAS